MKAVSWVAILVFGGGVAMAGCGDSSGEDGTGGTGGNTTGTGSGTGTGTGSNTGTGTGTGTNSSTSTGTGTGTGEGDGICGTDLVTPNEVLDGCLTANCCSTFDPCAADAECSACLMDSAAPGCDANSMFQAYLTCSGDTCPTAICGTTLGYNSPNLNACLEGSCCETFNACESDPACNACLQNPDGVGCDVNQGLLDFNACRDVSCLTDICDSQIGYVNNYENGASDTAYDTNFCGTTNCCEAMTACADPTGDGYLEMDDPESDACLECLIDPNDPACPGGEVATAAAALLQCINDNC